MNFLKNPRMYCRDDLSLVENYDKAKPDGFKGWHMHHRLELTLDGQPALTGDDLKRMGMYYNRPYFELIFLTVKEHRKLHSHHTDNTRAKISARNVGMRGKRHTAESRELMSRATILMMSDEKTRMHCGDYARGKHWHVVNGRRVYYV